MDEFHLDADLLVTLKHIREGVRQLFEQLRLRQEDGDISGKARLERVPALAKRNFGNLARPDCQLAIKEAWRLVDFLEGSEEARLSARAREALRTIELDKQLATFRASQDWKRAAAGLREALDGTVDHPRAGGPSLSAAASQGGDAISSVSQPAGDPRHSHGAEIKRVPSSGKLRRPLLGAAAGVAILVTAAMLTATRWFEPRPDPREACLALENASDGALAQHWAPAFYRSVPRPAARPDATPHIFPISDPPNGPVQSTWTTSEYSYAERTTQAGPGGGLSDFRLRVGGWGDTYLSLLQVPIPTNRVVQKAVVQLTVLGDEPRTRPTSMTLRAVLDSWRPNSGPIDRLWWRDCPRSYVVERHLPPPGPPESTYQFDITDLYNMWARGQHTANGIMLEPEQVGKWDPRGPRYGNFDTFYSTRASDPASRPRLVLTY